MVHDMYLPKSEHFPWWYSGNSKGQAHCSWTRKLCWLSWIQYEKDRGWPPRRSSNKKALPNCLKLSLYSWIHMDFLAEMEMTLSVWSRKTHPMPLQLGSAKKNPSTLIFIVLNGGKIHTMLGLRGWGRSGEDETTYNIPVIHTPDHTTWLVQSGEVYTTLDSQSVVSLFIVPSSAPWRLKVNISHCQVWQWSWWWVC